MIPWWCGVPQRRSRAARSCDPEAHPGGPGQTPHLIEPLAPGPLGHDDLFQGVLGLAQGRQDRMASVDDLGH